MEFRLNFILPPDPLCIPVAYNTRTVPLLSNLLTIPRTGPEVNRFERRFSQSSAIISASKSLSR
jgi:hypothetical protein